MALHLTGSCLCGAVRFECRCTPISAVFCHCRDCQKAHAAPYAACVGVPPGSITLLAGQPKRYETLAESGATVFREFCGQCGTHLFSGSAAYSGFKSIKIASLDDPAKVSPVAHVWTKRLIKWACIDDGLPRFSKNADMAELQHLWSAKREGAA